MSALETIGKYQIRRQLGQGAMGVVREGFDPLIERRVAIKTLRLEVFEPSQLADIRERFKREAQSAGRLSHPNIVTIHEYGEHEGAPYIVMEYMTGKELSRYLDRGTRLPLSEVVRLMTQLLGALTYAHANKVVHRDIKPANIFILEDGSLKVVDFGIARVEASNLTETGALLGTPAYMSPEQFLALPVDERSDVFSAGVILYELLTGDRPFTGSVTTIMQKILRQDPIEPSVLNPILSSTWDAVVARALAKKPDARFQSARQFAETIEQVFGGGTAIGSAEATVIAGSGIAGPREKTLRTANVSTPSTIEPAPIRALATASEIKISNAPGKWKILSIAGAVVAAAAGGGLLVGGGLFDAKMPASENRSATPSSPKVIAPDTAAAEKSAPMKAVATKAPAETSVAEKVPTEQRAVPVGVGAEAKASAEKAPAERNEADRAAAESAAIAKAAAERTQAENAGIAAGLAAERAVTDRVAAERAAAQTK